MSDTRSREDSPVDPAIGGPVEHQGVPLVLWVFPLLCSLALPGLVWIVSERPMAIRFDQGIGMALGVGLVALAFVAALTGGFRKRWRWALSVTAVSMLALFQWPLLTFAGRVLASALPIPLIEDIFPVLMAVAFIWLAVRRGGEWPFAAILGTGFLFAVIALVIAAIPYVELATPEPRGSAAPGSPDVVLLILDGYTRADILSEQFDHDNTQFLADLESLDFEVADEANANYGFTYASVASMLDLDFVYSPGPTDEEAHDRMRHALSGAPALFDTFRTAGYEIVSIENAWQGSHCGAAVDGCVRDGFTERIMWSLSEVTVFAPLVRSVRPHPFNTMSVEHLETLPDIVAADRVDGLPRLTMAHVLLPHPPFLRDASCSYVNTGVRRSFTTPSDELIENRRDFYVGQLQCTNGMVLEAVAAIVEQRPNTLIMITGDHGSGSTRLANVDQHEWSDEAITERMGILSAYRLPECDGSVYPTMSPVNGTRVLANCAIDAGLDPLPDLTLWAPHDGEGIVTDVAARLDD